MKEKVTAIIAAAGMGKRMGTKIKKQYIVLGDKPVLAHTIEKFENCNLVNEIILVVKSDEIDYCKENIVNKYGFNKIEKIVSGGKERQESVYNGIKAIDNTDIVLIHDGARPFVTEKMIIDSIETVKKYNACVVGVPVKDTIKVVDDKNFIKNTPNRKTLYKVQTPQSFKYDLILKAYEKADIDKYSGTDDASLVEYIGEKVKIIIGDYRNIKITTIEDLSIVKSLL